MNYYIVTGASRGLGAALARLLIQRGATVIGISRSSNHSLQPATSAVPPASGRFIEVLVDLAAATRIPEAVADALSQVEWPRAEAVVLVNNAGVIDPIGPIDMVDAYALDRHLRVNLNAPLLLTASFLRHTRSATVPRTVVNVSSGASQSPYAGWSAYCSAKAGLNMLTRTVAEEQASAPNPARVIAVAPSVVDTTMQDTIRATPAEHFPRKEKFVTLKNEGGLVSPEKAAARLLRAIEDPTIPSGEYADLRRKYGSDG